MASAFEIEQVIANLGTPVEPTEQAVRAFLAEFLGDPMVVEWPAWFWKPILHGIVLRRRPARVARLYSSIWSEQGAPLRVQTESIVAGIAEALPDSEGVSSAYRYGSPSIDDVLERAFSRSARVVFTNLFPQRTASSSGSADRQAYRAAERMGRADDLTIAPLSPTDGGYVQALADRVRSAAELFEDGPADHLLVSFHSIPESANRREGGVYTADCKATFDSLLDSLDWDPARASLAYQSVFGPAKWVGPATCDRLAELAKSGVSKLLVTTPGFLCDGLETLEEIAVEGRKTFMAAGGLQMHCTKSVSGHSELLKSLAALGR